MSRDPIQVHLFDRSGVFGAGLAYSTNAEEHVLNVPASKMSALPDVPTHFSDWLQAAGLVVGEAVGKSYVPRRYYRWYLQELLQQTSLHPGNPKSRLCLEPDEVVSIEGKYAVRTSTGTPLNVDAVVLATGYLPESNLDCERKGFSGFHRAYEPEKWPTESIKQVVIVGSRLTALDAVLSVLIRYPQARITVVSRYGYLPGLHNAEAPVFAISPLDGITGVRQTVKWARSEVVRAQAQGLPWQSVSDAMRSHWESIWQNLTVKDKQRFQDHVARHFDRFRHRVSAEVGEIVLDNLRSGTLRILAGSVQLLSKCGPGIRVVKADRTTEVVIADLVLDCSGTSMSWALSEETLFRQLFADGQLVEGPNGIGVVANAHGRIVDSNHQTGNLFAIGPLLKGVRWETTAVHEIRHQIEQVADEILGGAGWIRTTE